MGEVLGNENEQRIGTACSYTTELLQIGISIIQGYTIIESIDSVAATEQYARGQQWTPEVHWRKEAPTIGLDEVNASAYLLY
jgi:hypothetical protein